jgi:hypothetical protein
MFMQRRTNLTRAKSGRISFLDVSCRQSLLSPRTPGKLNPRKGGAARSVESCLHYKPSPSPGQAKVNVACLHHYTIF